MIETGGLLLNFSDGIQLLVGNPQIYLIGDRSTVLAILQSKLIAS
ncbi:MAG: hypothetical protein AAF383_27865 [Cyanobacteria bacterium P01_A01_bin.83]